MTTTAATGATGAAGAAGAPGAPGGGTGLRVEHRYRLHRAGILNVWQYDRQEFSARDGRLLLRGANGAGKSKTLEMLLPFVLDGDKARITASARHHTSLLWLMTDGYAGQARIGYLWVEFARTTPEGHRAFYTCGVGIRASTSAKTATAWFFTTPGRIGHDLDLEDEAGPLTRPRLAERLAERLGEQGHVFDSARPYKEHVGRTLFGLEVEQYDDVLRLLYWLRQPQIGEDIEPARLTTQLAHALPQLDEHTLRTTGETFDSLAAVGEELARRTSAAEGLSRLSAAYAAYSRSVAGARGRAARSAHAAERGASVALRREQLRTTRLAEQLVDVDAEQTGTTRSRDEARARREELRDSREARDQRRLTELAEQARAAGAAADRSRAASAKEQDRYRRRAEQSDAEVGRVTARLQALIRDIRAVDQALTEARVTSPLAVPAALDAPIPSGPAGRAEQAARLAESVAGLAPAVRLARTGARRRAEEVSLVRDAVGELVTAQQRAERAAEDAAAAEQRWEESVAQRDTAAAASDVAEQRHAGDWTAWLADAAAVTVDGPPDLGEDSLADARDRARSAAGARLVGLREEEAAHQVTLRQADALLAELQDRYAVIKAEQDPAPPPPALTRTPRPDGAPLWRLVDFVEELADAERAGLEAALQDSGLLDAWVRPDGALLGPDHLDVVLPAGPGADGPSLRGLLVPDPRGAADVAPDVVAALLGRIGTRPDGPGAHASPDGFGAHAAPDGTWSMGALRGRSHKARAQFVGATARADERRRRLEELRVRRVEVQASREQSASGLASTRAVIATSEAWLARMPSDRELVAARARVAALEHAVSRDGATLEIAQRAATAARTAVTGIRDALARLAADHALPTEDTALQAIGQRLDQLGRDLALLAERLDGHEQALRRLGGILTERDEAQVSAAAAATAAGQDRESAEQVAARHAELEASVGAEVRELAQRVRELDDAVRAAEARLEEVRALREDLVAERARAERDVETARQRREDASAHRVRTVREVGELASAPGLLDSAFAPVAAPGAAVLARAHEADAEIETPSDVLDAIEQMAMLGASAPPAPPTSPTSPTSSTSTSPSAASAASAASQDRAAEDEPDATGVWRAYTEASSGPAAAYEPEVAQHGRLLAVLGQDDAGAAPIAELADRVAAAVERDRGLLTEREKEQFERHVLGELGEAIRRRRHEADELVRAMNRLLAGVTTSQGIQVRLRWRLREDVPAEARESVRLLAAPLGALLPEERASLRDSLHRLIEVSRSERPDLSYSEHLAVALDYREWFAFRIQYTRPESEGSWLELHRRSPLSQGEQKVLCYLPLFAAAAAHFTSLAGAAPHAPRLVLLDDAFPKIDVRTHPLLFGLLVDLDLDFVITSERLWGDHDTVPALAIYEALRDPSERGIAQFEYRWDGRQLHAVG